MISAETLENCRSKMLHKYGRFLDSLNSGRKTLFIRMCGHHDAAIPSPYVNDPRGIRASDLNALCSAISRKFPALPFALAFVFLKGRTPVALQRLRLDSRIRVFEISGDSPSWEGSDDCWTEIFDGFRFGLKRSDADAQQFVGELQRERLYG
jgi:hypothetical protein